MGCSIAVYQCRHLVLNCTHDSQWHEDAVWRSHRFVESADIVYISLDRHGASLTSIAEVGMAIALKKIILIDLNQVPLRRRWEFRFLVAASHASISNKERPSAAHAFETVPFIRRTLGSLERYLQVTKKYMGPPDVDRLLASAARDQRELSARVIQRAWRLCVTSPTYLACIRRLNREFASLCPTDATRLPEALGTGHRTVRCRDSQLLHKGPGEPAPSGSGVRPDDVGHRAGPDAQAR